MYHLSTTRKTINPLILDCSKTQLPAMKPYQKIFMSLPYENCFYCMKIKWEINYSPEFSMSDRHQILSESDLVPTQNVVGRTSDGISEFFLRPISKIDNSSY